MKMKFETYNDEDDFIVDMKQHNAGTKKKAFVEGFKGVGSRIGSGFRKTGQFLANAGKTYATNQEIARKNRLKNLQMQITEESLKNKLYSIRSKRKGGRGDDDLINLRGFRVL